jgi:hypothetical protein
MSQKTVTKNVAHFMLNVKTNVEIKQNQILCYPKDSLKFIRGAKSYQKNL